MSSIRIVRPHGGHKPGDVVSVPFTKGREMIAAGVAEYLHGAPKKARPKPAEPAPEPAVAFEEAPEVPEVADAIEGAAAGPKPGKGKKGKGRKNDDAPAEAPAE